MNGTSKTFLKKTLAEKKLKQNYLLGSIMKNPKQYNQISTIGKALEKDIMTEKRLQTPFGRTINAPIRKALNYLLQSSSSDNTLDRFCKISNFLRATRSHVAFVVHDSVVIDLHKDDRRLIPELVEMFSDTKLGKFKVNCSLGKNLGSMREFSW